MNKPQSLRAALEDALPDLKRDPERLLVFVNKGKIVSTAINNLSFEYRFDVELLFTDFAAHIDNIIVPIMDWCKTNEPDVFAAWRNTGAGIEFQAELLDDNKADIAITIPLTEAVLVHPVEGGYTTEHLGEPSPQDPIGLTMENTGNLQTITPVDEHSPPMP